MRVSGHSLYIKKLPIVLSDDEYYHLMSRFSIGMGFRSMYIKWYSCFTYILKSYKVGYNQMVIDSLFHDFDMSNWHFKSEYENLSKNELLKNFCSDAMYISDRTSYDRLFRVHWFFITAYSDEMNLIKYPTVYSKKSIKKVTK